MIHVRHIPKTKNGSTSGLKTHHDKVIVHLGLGNITLG